ncbi:MAG: DNA repair protein RecO [Nitrospinaceae bacterium]
MGLYKTEGIVLRSINFSETDKVVTFMTEKYGKVKCVAKSARKIKSRFTGTLEPMTHLRLIYFGKENQELYRLNHADIFHSFYSVRDDFQKMYTGIYFLELVDKMVHEGHREIPVFQLLLQALEALGSGDRLEALPRLFEARLLSHLGYRPQLNYCTTCKTDRLNGCVGFDFFKNSVLCEGCAQKSHSEIQFSAGTLNYLRKLLTLDVHSCGRLKFPKGTGEEIEKVTHRLVLSHLGRELKSYPFIKQMAAVG